MTSIELAPSAPDTARRRDPYADPRSLEFRMRSRRFAVIRDMIDSILMRKGRVEIVDLGGTEGYWRIGREYLAENRGRITITLVNTEIQAVEQQEQFRFLNASATDPDLFANRRFDMVHSNSVIEHVGDWRQMELFAANVRRLARTYYVQTPDYWFPYEPHFRFPGFQYLPEAIRVGLIMRFALGFFSRIANREEAWDIIRHHQLLSTRQMRTLFLDGEVFHEKFAGMNKSIIAVKRF